MTTHKPSPSQKWELQRLLEVGSLSVGSIHKNTLHSLLIHEYVQNIGGRVSLTDKGKQVLNTNTQHDTKH